MIIHQSSHFRKAKEEGNDEAVIASPPALVLRDEIVRLPMIKGSTVCKGLDLVLGRNNELRVCTFAIIKLCTFLPIIS